MRKSSLEITLMKSFFGEILRSISKYWKMCIKVGWLFFHEEEENLREVYIVNVGC